MFYVGRSGTVIPTVHLSPLGGMTLCGILAPRRDRMGRRWWRQEFETLSIADVLRRISIEEKDPLPPCGSCLRIGRVHPERLLSR